MKGIDISAWQEDIDWQEVINAGIEFVIVKLGEAGSIDEMYETHIENAVNAGLNVGVYVYSRADSVDAAVTEAQWTIEVLGNRSLPIGVWFDAEDHRMTGDVTLACKAFIDTITTAGYKAGVYTSYNWLTCGTIDADGLNAPLWVAQYNSTCDFQHSTVELWQYTDHFSDTLPYDGNVTV